jgi:hypothetical protein
MNGSSAILIIISFTLKPLTFFMLDSSRILVISNQLKKLFILPEILFSCSSDFDFVICIAAPYCFRLLHLAVIAIYENKRGFATLFLYYSISYRIFIDNFF